MKERLLGIQNVQSIAMKHYGSSGRALKLCIHQPCWPPLTAYQLIVLSDSLIYQLPSKKSMYFQADTLTLLITQVTEVLSRCKFPPPALLLLIQRCALAISEFLVWFYYVWNDNIKSVCVCVCLSMLLGHNLLNWHEKPLQAFHGLFPNK